MATGASDDTIFLRLRREWAGVARGEAGGAAKEALECGRGGQAADVASHLPAAAAATPPPGLKRSVAGEAPLRGVSSGVPGELLRALSEEPVMGTGKPGAEMGPGGWEGRGTGKEGISLSMLHRRVGGGARLGGEEPRARNEKGSKTIAEPGVKLSRANGKSGGEGGSGREEAFLVRGGKIRRVNKHWKPERQIGFPFIYFWKCKESHLCPQQEAVLSSIS